LIEWALLSLFLGSFFKTFLFRVSPTARYLLTHHPTPLLDLTHSRLASFRSCPQREIQSRFVLLDLIHPRTGSRLRLCTKRKYLITVRVWLVSRPWKKNNMAPFFSPCFLALFSFFKFKTSFPGLVSPGRPSFSFCEGPSFSFCESDRFLLRD